ncbi:MAG TPA: c-type cytochrome [Gammaproteobacteria bacterium]|nr:c-type cytochrome [Gammaproteobacteria bacterium]
MQGRPLALLLCGLVSQAALADGDVPAGQQIALQGNGKGAMACVGCHGVNGEGNAAAGFPRLAGLSDHYLVKQLQGYKQGTRQNPVMQPIATVLEEQEMRDVAAYYAGMTPAGGTSDTEGGEAGEVLALRGAWDQDIPACISCHGPGGRGVDPHFPALAGQHAGYLKTQLQAWRAGTRNNDENDLMGGVAERMTEAQIDAVVAFFAGLDPVEPVAGDAP